MNLSTFNWSNSCTFCWRFLTVSCSFSWTIFVCSCFCCSTCSWVSSTCTVTTNRLNSSLVVYNCCFKSCNYRVVSIFSRIIKCPLEVTTVYTTSISCNLCRYISWVINLCIWYIDTKVSICIEVVVCSATLFSCFAWRNLCSSASYFISIIACWSWVILSIVAEYSVFIYHFVVVCLNDTTVFTRECTLT